MSVTAPGEEQQANSLRRIFLSPNDGRLRSGWRLLLHGIAFFFFTVIITFIFLTVASFTALPPINDPLVTLGLTAGASLPAAVAATWLARKYLDRRPLIGLGLDVDDHLVSDLAIGFLMPAPLFAIVLVIELGAGWLSFSGIGGGVSAAAAVPALLFMLGAFIAVGVYEELLFRGYQLVNLAEALPLQWALLIVALIFSLAHSGNPGANPMSALGIFLAAYLLAYAWLRTGQLWLPIGFHIGWNFFQGPIFGFPVSGLESYQLLQHQVSGPTWITGGRFGPEAGLIGFLAMAIGAGMIWWYTQERRGPSIVDRSGPAAEPEPSQLGEDVTG